MADFPTFEQFFADAHGYAPYPWQSRLAAQVKATGRWPDRVAIPTGLGKTACIDVALWHLAADISRVSARPDEGRRAPLRIFHVVDRRSIIDQTYRGLEDLVASANGAAKDVLDLLSKHFRGQPIVGRLHGDAPDDRSWLTAHRPVVISLTTHQFVSRLLFRGFGVSPSMSRIHAGLTGIDRLVLVDEPHLSVPAVHTILAQERLQGAAADAAKLGVPIGQTVLLGATIPPDLERLERNPTVLALDDEDRRAPAARRRIESRRDLIVHKTASSDGAVRKALVKAALTARSEDTVLVMVNTVDLAQHVYADLAEKHPGEVLLVTSRFRAHDKKALTNRVLAHAPGADRGESPATPRFVVSTQTLEVGVDLSFRMLVTEACPWPALAQRVGRLNRDGAFDDHATVHLVTGVRKGTAAIYNADATAETMRIAADMPSLALIHHGAFAGDATWGPSPHVPTLHAGLLPVLTHSSPRPVTDIDPVPFIAGALERSLLDDVRVFWREDLSGSVLAATPPTAAEYVDVPVSAVRRLVARALGPKTEQTSEPADTFGDASLAFEGGDRPVPLESGLRPMRRADDGTWHEVSNTAAIQPGDTIAVHTSDGGYTPERGWDGASRLKVNDLSYLSLADPNGSFAVTEQALRGLLAAASALTERERSRVLETALAVLEVMGSDDTAALAEPGALVDELIDSLHAAIPEVVPPSEEATWRTVPKVAGSGWLLVIGQREPARVAARRSASVRAGSPDDPRTLENHANQCAHEALDAAQVVGLPDRLRSQIGHAALRHDDGKVRPAFQDYLRIAGGLPRAPVRTFDLQAGETPNEHRAEFLAKSGNDQASTAERKRQRQRAGLEDSWPHAAYSAQFAWHAKAPDLITHFAASHHGRGCPLDDPAGVDEVDGGICECEATGQDRLAKLHDQYGAWGLAYLEAHVRLADHRASAEPVARTPRPKLPAWEEREPELVVDRHDVELPGLSGTSPLHLWAALGAFVAAVDEDPGARLSYRREAGQLIPVVHTSATLDDIAERLAGTVDLIQKAEEVLGGQGRSAKKVLRAKNQKISYAQAQQALRLLPPRRADWTEAQALVAAVVSDIRIADGKVELCTPFVPSNANGFESAMSAAGPAHQRVDLMRRLLTDSDDVSQYSAGNVHGMAEEQINTAQLSGLGDDLRAVVRALAMIPVVYGLKAISNNGFSSLSVERRTMTIPIPSEPTSLTRLLALWRTVPSSPRPVWVRAGVMGMCRFTKTLLGHFNFYRFTEYVDFDGGRERHG